MNRNMMPATKEHYELYEEFDNTFTDLNRIFNRIRGASPNAGDRQEFIECRQRLYDINSKLFSRLEEINRILDEPQIETLRRLIDDVFSYHLTLNIVLSVDLETERRLRGSSISEEEVRLDNQFIETQAIIRRFFLGFSLREWWRGRKSKSHRK